MTVDSAEMMENEIHKDIYNSIHVVPGSYLSDHTKARAFVGYMGGNELKPWGEMTVEEINKNIQERCKYCMYRSRDSGYTYCDYFFVTGELRKCSPFNCEKYKEDAQRKRKNKPMTVKRKRGKGKQVI